jgi:hypothetical protein
LILKKVLKIKIKIKMEARGFLNSEKFLKKLEFEEFVFKKKLFIYLFFEILRNSQKEISCVFQAK